MKKEYFSSIEEITKELQSGKPIIILDDKERENEGDIVLAGEKITPDLVNFMIKECKGLICTPMTKERLKSLEIDQMIKETEDPFKTRFTISVDAKESTTGISAFERATTIKKLADFSYGKEAFVKPGHIFPIEAFNEGVLKRRGHTEATIDLLKIAGLTPVGVICEIIKEDGTMAREKDLEVFAKKFNLKMIRIEDIVKYREQENIKKQVTTLIPTPYGDLQVSVYEERKEKELLTHLVIVKGNVKNKEKVVVRLHSKCFTGDILSSFRCDCGDQLKETLKLIEKSEDIVLLYLDQEGRGIGIIEKLKAYNLQDQGLNTYEANEELGFLADERDYTIAALILKDLKVLSINILTNNPLKVSNLKENGIKINERLALVTKENKTNKDYLKSKKEIQNHMF